MISSTKPPSTPYRCVSLVRERMTAESAQNDTLVVEAGSVKAPSPTGKLYEICHVMVSLAKLVLAICVKFVNGGITSASGCTALSCVYELPVGISLVYFLQYFSMSWSTTPVVLLAQKITSFCGRSSVGSKMLNGEPTQLKNQNC